MRVLLTILCALMIAPMGACAAAQEAVSVPVWSEGLTPPLIKVSIGSYPNLPYSAKSITTSSAPKSDGSFTTGTQEGFVYRDAEGRTRTEITREVQNLTYKDRDGTTRTMDVTQIYGGGKHTVTVADPVEGITFSWTIDDQSAKKQVTVYRSAPRPSANSTRTTPAFPEPPDTIRVYQSAGRHIETLGAQTINGLYAEGYRETSQTRDPSTVTDKTATTEEWLSPDLKIVVRKILTDQRFASESHPEGAVNRIDLTNINRSDPDPELFKLPVGYEVVEVGGRRGH